VVAKRGGGGGAGGKSYTRLVTWRRDPTTALVRRGALSEIRIRAGYSLEGAVVEKRSVVAEHGGGAGSKSYKRLITRRCDHATALA
jgi:hypothetical protein